MSTAMPPGGSWIVGEFPSPARMNRKTVTHIPGGSVAGLTTYPNMAIIITADGGNFQQDEFLIRNSANTAWLSSTSGKHTHNADTDIAGGLLSEIRYFNATVAYTIDLNSCTLGDFAKLGTASTSDDSTTGRTTITTGTTAGTYAHLGKHGVPISFVRRSRFLLMGYVTDGNNLTVRAGVGAENVNLAPETGVPRYGMEICDVTGSDRNWDCFTGNGTARSGEQTTAPVETSASKFYRFDYTPGTNVIMYVNNVAVKTKSTNVPSGTGSFTLTNGLNNVSFGIKTANTTSKSFHIKGMHFEGTGSDAAWMA